MATSSVSDAIDFNLSSLLKCTQCRNTLEEIQQFDTTTDENLIKLEQDTLPSWIEGKIEESGWTKGKLCCPKCSNRIGGFDFVGNSPICIYLVKSKIDINQPRSLAEIFEKKKADTASDTNGEALSLPVLSDSGRRVETLESNTSENQSSSLLTSSSDSSLSSVTTNSLNDNINLGDSTSEDEASDIENVSPSRKKNLSKMRSRRNIKRKRKRRKLKESKLKNDQHEDAKEKLKMMILGNEPELDGIPDNLICPVCLNLLYDPFKVNPCDHLFCEPCLRRLGMKSAMNTPCPLCRTRISICLPEKDLTKEIRENHKILYQRRKKSERSSNVYKYPLPWRPGWRSLISRRPFGGNSFPDESFTAFLFRVIEQIPYFVPNVIWANIMNLILMFLCLGTFEILPLFMRSLNHLNVRDPLHQKFNHLRRNNRDFHYEDRNNQCVILPMLEQLQLIISRMSENSELQQTDERHLKSPELMQISLLDREASLFYFAMSVSAILVATISNFILAQQNEDFLFEDDWFLGRMLTRFPRLRRFSTVEFILVLGILFIVCLPLVLPASQALNPRPGSSSGRMAGIMARMGFSLKPYLLLLGTAVFGGIYWVAVLFLERDIREG